MLRSYNSRLNQALHLVIDESQLWKSSKCELQSLDV